MEDKDRKNEPLNVELFFDDESDLEVLVETKEFHDLLFHEVIRALRVAIEKKQNKATILFLTNMRSALIVTQENFASLIDNVILYFEKLENYEKCNELIELKSKL